jgi:hypothetical protein
MATPAPCPGNPDGRSTFVYFGSNMINPGGQATDGRRRPTSRQPRSVLRGGTSAGLATTAAARVDG